MLEGTSSQDDATCPFSQDDAAEDNRGGREVTQGNPGRGAADIEVATRRMNAAT